MAFTDSWLLPQTPTMCPSTSGPCQQCCPLPQPLLFPKVPDLPKLQLLSSHQHPPCLLMSLPWNQPQQQLQEPRTSSDKQPHQILLLLYLGHCLVLLLCRHRLFRSGALLFISIPLLTLTKKLLQQLLCVSVPPQSSSISDDYTVTLGTGLTKTQSPQHAEPEKPHDIKSSLMPKKEETKGIFQ